MRSRSPMWAMRADRNHGERRSRRQCKMPGQHARRGRRMQCTASYAVKQSDIEAGSVTNKVSVDSDQTEIQTAEATSTAVQSEGLSVEVSSSSRFTKAGDVLDYSFVLRNSGNMPLANVNLGAPLFGPGSISSCSRPELAPAAEITCSSPYTVTQADVDAGEVVIEVTARGIGTGEIVGHDALTITLSTGPSDEEVRNSFENLTGLFMAQRADRILQNEPRFLRLARPRHWRGAGRAGGQFRGRRQRHRRQLLGKPARHACARPAAGRRWPA